MLAVKTILSDLEALASPVVAKKMASSFDPPIPHFGIPQPRTQSLAKNWAQHLRRPGGGGYQQAVKLSTELLKRTELEAWTAGTELLRLFVEDFDSKLLPKIRRWVDGPRCGAQVDALASRVAGPWLVRFPEELDAFTAWARSRNPWKRRAAVVTFVVPARNGDLHAPAMELIDVLLKDPHEVVQKSLGWLLREIANHDPRRVLKFLQERGEQVPKLVARGAVEKMDSSTRRSVLGRRVR